MGNLHKYDVEPSFIFGIIMLIRLSDFAFIWPQMPFDLHSNLIIPINTKYQVNFSLSLSLLHTKCEFYSSCTIQVMVFTVYKHTQILYTHIKQTPITMARNTKTSLEVWKPFEKHHCVYVEILRLSLRVRPGVSNPRN